MKGHVLQGSPGCPVKKFEGVDGTGYMDDLPVPTPELPAVGASGCCGHADGELKPMGWPEVWRHFQQAMADWKKSGFQLTEPADYVKRIQVCRDCPKKQYQWFQCRQCKCIVYTKAKLATETCPYGLWPKL